VEASRRVLVVDNAEAQCDAIVRMLQDAGYGVIRATTGAEALAVAFEQQLDLVLLDINLPDTSGFILAQTFKAASNTRHLPIIFYSASRAPSEGVEEKAAELGAFLTTPIERNHLLNVVRGTLARAARS
jgi:CheY-like chemotaxis protein